VSRFYITDFRPYIILQVAGGCYTLSPESYHDLR